MLAMQGDRMSTTNDWLDDVIETSRLTGDAYLQLLRVKDEIDQKITQLVNEAKNYGRFDGQYYYLHRIKEAIALGKNIYECIDELEGETRLKDRQRLAELQSKKG